MFKRYKSGFVLAGCVLMMAVPVWADGNEKHENEQQMKLEDCPTAVQQTIRDNAAGGQIESVEKESERGQVVYEADVKKTDGNEVEVKVDVNGKLLNVKKERQEEEKEESQEK